MTGEFGETRQYRVGLRAAMGEVESSLASPAANRAAAWAKLLRSDLEKLSEQLERHIAMSEGPGGMLDDILATAPQLASRVDQARREHEALRYRMHAALQALPGDGDGDLDVAAVRECVVEALGALVRHRHLGSDLVYEAFNVNIESAD